MRRTTRAQSPQVRRFRRHSPREWFYGFLRDLPGVHDLLVTVIGAMPSIVANLTPAKGRQDHTTSPSAHASFVCRGHWRPSHPAPNVRDDREAPLLWSAGRGEDGADLGERSMPSGCDRLTRRADRAGRACESCPPGNINPTGSLRAQSSVALVSRTRCSASWRCFAEPGPMQGDGPRISSAPRRKNGALRRIRGTRSRHSESKQHLTRSQPQRRRCG